MTAELATELATDDRTILVLDFDGVICDSWRECALVTWGGHHGWLPTEFGPSAFDALPADFAVRFLALRGFACDLGHFAVPLLDGSKQVRTQADFDRLYAALPLAAVTAFVTRASHYRDAARIEQRERWLAFHDLYEGLPDLLSELADRLYLVTARDLGSVQELLSSHAVAIPPERIYGEQQSKLWALADIQAKEGVGAGSVYLIDDSLSNVVAAREAGHAVAWAQWGYSAPEHDEEAARLGVPRLALPDLPAMAVAVAGRTGFSSVLRSGQTRRCGRPDR